MSKFVVVSSHETEQELTETLLAHGFSEVSRTTPLAVTHYFYINKDFMCYTVDNSMRREGYVINCKDETWRPMLIKYVYQSVYKLKPWTAHVPPILNKKLLDWLEKKPISKSALIVQALSEFIEKE